MSTPALSRLSYMDTLKVLAAFMIVLLHVSAIYVDPAAVPRGELVYLINTIVRPGLLIFMMVSGALLLRAHYIFNFKKKFFYIAKIYILWSAFYVCVEQLAYLGSGNPLLNPQEMVVHWIRGPYHFWYLSMLLGMYIFMPILSRLKDFHTLNYFVMLSFVMVYILPYAEPYLPDCVNGFIQQMTVFSMGQVLFFFLLGAWLHQLPLEKSLFNLASLLFTVGLLLTIYQLNTAENYNIVMGNSAIKSFSQLFLALGLFYMIRYAYKDRRGSERTLLASKCALHIYITSAFVIYVYEYLIQPYWDEFVPFNGISTLFWSIIVFIVSFGLAYMVFLKDRWLKHYRTKKAQRPSKANK